jgi:hypothetical protein
MPGLKVDAAVLLAIAKDLAELAEEAATTPEAGDTTH